MYLKSGEDFWKGKAMSMYHLFSGEDVCLHRDAAFLKGDA